MSEFIDEEPRQAIAAVPSGWNLKKNAGIIRILQNMQRQPLAYPAFLFDPLTGKAFNAANPLPVLATVNVTVNNINTLGTITNPVPTADISHISAPLVLPGGTVALAQAIGKSYASVDVYVAVETAGQTVTLDTFTITDGVLTFSLGTMSFAAIGATLTKVVSGLPLPAGWTFNAHHVPTANLTMSIFAVERT